MRNPLEIKDLSIGDLARRTETKVQTIRYYEEIGLLPAPARTEGKQRVYGLSTLRRLAFIRHARDLGFPVEAIRDLLRLSDHPEQPCGDADAIARRHLAEVEDRIKRLRTLQKELKRMIDQHRCDGGSIADCRVIEVLSDHALCGHGH
ncbi:MerR family transcriptional regulator [Zavarzinia compransoris]|uniref:MerR family transcriptional regulator n=1 Tax=Zavarzinia compransoris TaxID=1264899 RepID=A0A317E9R3_9PROT|nr:helix-turn-helix domain-containing protein [Zavarzinia compransoris]PWR23044.1 MerR family transcriptional regulator [Zavarzinia compransoris]TDP46411.1 DNA-binding transcriptional MerR regulator [Zavarzinia compransoris]